MADFQPEKFITVSMPGSGGLHTSVDPQDIDDTEMADCRNVVYEGGYVQPRLGYTQLFAKPQGETQDPNVLARGTTSDGTDMLIAIYGSNFYLWDPLNGQTIPLNKGSTQSFQGVPGDDGYQRFWSYDTWLGGIGSDVMYFADGVDATTKWQMSLEYPSYAALSTDYQILVPYPNRLSASGGNLIFVINGTPTVLTASAVDNVLTITTGTNIATFSLASSNSAQIVANPAAGVYTLTFTANPTAADTFTFTINGTAVTLTAVTTIGASAGNFLIGTGGNIVNTVIDMYQLLTNPSLTNSTQVALSSPNQTLVSYLSYSTYANSAIYFNGSAIGTAIPLGTAITTPITYTDQVPVCSIVKSLQTRLWAVGGKGTESRISWSQTIVPENFSTNHSNNTDPGTTVWGDGRGGINGIMNGSGGIWFLKEDSIAQGQFIYSQDATTTYLFSLEEFASGLDIGVSDFKRILNNENTAYYLTESSGVTGLSSSQQLSLGTTVSSSASVSFSSISDKIIDRLQTPTKIYHFDRTTAFFDGRFGYWAVAEKEGQGNTLLLCYDFTFGYWTVFDGWPVQDMAEYDDDFLFMSNADGSVNTAFDGTSDNGFPFTAYWRTKRFDFGEPALPKTVDKVFLQGYLDNITNLTASVLFNEDGLLWRSNYTIDGLSVYVLRGSQSGTIGADTLDEVSIGGSNQKNPPVQGHAVPFRCYLDTSTNYWFHNIQLEFKTNQAAPTWRVDKLGFNARVEDSYPASKNFILGPS